MATKPRVELEFVKVLVAPVIQRRENGKVVAEIASDPVPMFNADEVRAFMDEVERGTAAANLAASKSRAARRPRSSGPA